MPIPRLKKLITLLLLLTVVVCPGAWGAVDFNGDADYINVGDVDITGAITIAAWIKVDDVTSSRSGTIIAKRDGTTTNYAFEKDSTASGTSCGADQLRFYLYDGAWHIYCTSDANLVVGNWYHVAVTYAGSGAPIFYVNGEKKTSSTKFGALGGNLTANNVNAIIGWVNNPNCSPPTTTDCPFNGIIDDLFVKNSVLTQSQIQELYNSKIKRHFLQFSPSSCWTLDQGSDGSILNTTTGFYRDSCSTYNGTATDANGNSYNRAETVLSYPGDE